MQFFRDVLDECKFMDLGFKGFPFTWSRHFRDGISIWERMDIVVASQEWFSEFPSTRVNHIDSTTLDHKFLWIEILDLVFQQKKKNRFEELWLADKGCGEMVKGVWQATYDGVEKIKVIKKIEECGKELTRWSRKSFGNIRKDLEKKRKELARLEQIALQGGGTRWWYKQVMVDTEGSK